MRGRSVSKRGAKRTSGSRETEKGAYWEGNYSLNSSHRDLRRIKENSLASREIPAGRLKPFKTEAGRREYVRQYCQVKRNARPQPLGIKAHRHFLGLHPTAWAARRYFLGLHPTAWAARRHIFGLHPTAWAARRHFLGLHPVAWAARRHFLGLHPAARAARRHFLGLHPTAWAARRHFLGPHPTASSSALPSLNKPKSPYRAQFCFAPDFRQDTASAN